MINITLKKINRETSKTYEVSKISGSPVFPKDFLSSIDLDDTLFLCQLNLTEIQDELLPKTGYLYFFLDVSAYPPKAKVYYTNEPLYEISDYFNEGFEDLISIKGYRIIPTVEDTGFSICNKINPNMGLESLVEIEDYYSLFELDSISLPEGLLTLGEPDGWYMFLIKKEDLIKCDFTKVLFVSFGS